MAAPAAQAVRGARAAPPPPAVPGAGAAVRVRRAPAVQVALVAPGRRRHSVAQPVAEPRQPEVDGVTHVRFDCGLDVHGKALGMRLDHGLDGALDRAFERGAQAGLVMLVITVPLAAPLTGAQRTLGHVDVAPERLQLHARAAAPSVKLKRVCCRSCRGRRRSCSAA